MFRFVLYFAFLALCSAACVDKNADCPNKAWGCYVSDEGYLAWIRELCPKTCGVCTGTGGGYGSGNNGYGSSGECEDRTDVTCDQQFCSSIYITHAQKRMYCPATCKLC
ncbi:hypothetical protein QR680_013914 [Steinernema hermaphroditum]|uniref:ShKT domain-containing protein n=1 Tax=Steinernema hermaphroditum TaxID=289476 RepID=A0AA39I741_9BILA|nr:hypothetical protein QR680_013914 [Steinernema hermaphroditum]